MTDHDQAHDCWLRTGEPVGRWRIQRATREIDDQVDHVNLRREIACIRRDGSLVGALDAARERRRNRTSMLRDILTPSDDELARAREHGDHTLLEQAHAAARLTDRLPQPLHRAAAVVHQQFHVNEQTEHTLARRLRDLGRAAAKLKTTGTGTGKGKGKEQGATPLSRQAQRRAERQREQLTKQRAQTRAQIDAVRGIQRDLRAADAAITQRTQQLRELDVQHHRTVSRGLAALKVLGERGHPVEHEVNGIPVHGVLDSKTGTIRTGPWDSILTQPSRDEEAPHTLGGTGTVEALKAENARTRDGRPDVARRAEAVRDRAQLAELARQLDPTPPAPPRTTRTPTRQQPAARQDDRDRRQRDDGRER